MPHPNIPGGFKSEEERQKAQGKMPFKSEAQKRFMFAKHPDIAKRWVREGRGQVQSMKSGIKPSGTTVSNNNPVGTAGNPGSTDAANGRGGNLKRHQQMDEKKFGAISRRLKSLQDQKKGKK